MRGLRAIEELFASHIVSNLNKLSKEQLIKYLPDVKKSSNKKDLLIIMQNRITNRELSIEDIYNENKELFALTSNKLEEILKLNKPFFNWIKKHRKVKVVQIEKMELYGKVVAVPFWCAKDAYYLVYNSKRLKLLEEEFTSEKEKSKKVATPRSATYSLFNTL